MSLSRRRLIRNLAFGIPALPLHSALSLNTKSATTDFSSINKGPFEGTRASLRTYQIPEWFRDAKFGIWAHWGPESAVEAGDWYARNMYIETQAQYKYHLQTYGHPSKVGYKDLCPLWKAVEFEP